jgi:ABC-2 type transport system permease protein
VTGRMRRFQSSWLRFGAMLRKEFIQLRRDPLTLGLMIGIPAVQIVLFGFAIRTEVRNLPTVVLDESRSAASRQVVQAMENTGNFLIVGSVADRNELRLAIERGSAKAAIVIPPGFNADLKRGRRAQAQVIVDAADPLSSNSAIAGASLVGATIAIDGAAGRPAVPALDVRVRPWYNPALESAVFIVPGIIGVLLTMTMILITSAAIVRERERGTLEQLVVTPIDRTSLMLGKIVPFALIGFIQATVVLMLGRVLFDIPIRGSLPLLYAVTSAFIVANLALGMLVSTLARTQVQAMQISFFFLLPNILLSGFMFPRAAMPEFAQWIGAAMPLTYFLEVLRAILLKGAGWAAVWQDTTVLIAFGVLFMSLSVARFRKTMG